MDSYRSLSAEQIVSNKWENVKVLLDSAKDDNTPYAQREKEYFHLLRGLGILNIGWLVLPVVLVLKQGSVVVETRRIVTILQVSVVSLVFWVLVMFGPGTTSIQSSSYATVMLLFTALAALLTKLPHLLCYFLLTFHIAVFTINWLITPLINPSDQLMVTPNLFLIGLSVVAIACMVGLFYELVQETDCLLSADKTSQKVG